METPVFDERIVRITDIIEQIQKLNKMITLHREHSQDGFMQRQYEYMKAQFMRELKGLLENLEIMPGELAAA
jgi:hypothetical protein